MSTPPERGTITPGRGRIGCPILLALVCLLSWIPVAAVQAHGGSHRGEVELNRAIDANPDDASLYLERADLHRRHREWDKAIADLEHARERAPERSDIDLELGQLMVRAGKYRDAETVLSRRLVMAPDDADALIARGRARLANGHFDEAARDYDAAIALQSEPHGQIYIERAQAVAASGDPEDVKRALVGIDEGLARLGPIEALEHQAIELELQRGATDEALKRLDRAIARAKEPSALWMRRGQILATAERPREARVAYEQALASLSKLEDSRRKERLVGRVVREINRLSIMIATEIPTEPPDETKGTGD